MDDKAFAVGIIMETKKCEESPSNGQVLIALKWIRRNLSMARKIHGNYCNLLHESLCYAIIEIVLLLIAKRTLKLNLNHRSTVVHVIRHGLSADKCTAQVSGFNPSFVNLSPIPRSIKRREKECHRSSLISDTRKPFSLQWKLQIFGNGHWIPTAQVKTGMMNDLDGVTARPSLQWAFGARPLSGPSEATSQPSENN